MSKRLLLSIGLISLINIGFAQTAPSVPETVLQDNADVKLIQLTLAPNQSYTFTPSGKTCPHAVGLLLSPDKVKVKVTYQNKKEQMVTFHQGELYKQNGYQSRQIENVDHVTANFLYVDYKNFMGCTNSKSIQSN
jgi:hypothetical protein